MHEEKKFDEATYKNILLSELEIISEKTLKCSQKHINSEPVKILFINVQSTEDIDEALRKEYQDKGSSYKQ